MMEWDKNIEYYDVLTSTNEVAKEKGKSGAPHGTVILADCQTKGRGRLGREWTSPKGVNIYLSILLRPTILPDRASMLTLVMAVSVAKAMERLGKEKVSIKWPNDILIHGKKVCGILTEMSLQKNTIDSVVIGVGINVKKQSFPEELLMKATSLEQEWEQEVSKEELISFLLEAFAEDYESFVAAGDLSPFTAYYEDKLVNRNALVKVLDPKGEWEGIAKGITVTGELLVEKEDGRMESVYAGEVSIRGQRGYI